jgi:hypothetical protein
MGRMLGWNGRAEFLAMWERSGWKLNVTALTSAELLMAGGVLLLFAAVLLLIRRESRMVRESSEVTEELLGYLARIAQALEEPKRLSAEEVPGQMLRRLLEEGHAKAKGKVREMQLRK